MLPWRNSWFQIAFFAWLVSGALLVVDYAPKIPATSGWMTAFQREPRQPSEAPAKPSPSSEQQSPVKGPAPARQAPSPASEKPAPSIDDKSVTRGPTPARPAPDPSSEKPATKTPDATGTSAGSAELAQGKAAYDRKDYAQAMQWYQKSAAQGNAQAEYNIGQLPKPLAMANIFKLTLHHFIVYPFPRPGLRNVPALLGLNTPRILHA